MRFPSLAIRTISGVVLLAWIVVASGGCTGGSESSNDYPSRPIKVIVPFNAGGSSDTFARTIQKAITDHDLLPEPIVIVNRGGAGGTIGSRYFKHRRPDGYTVMLLHDAVLTAKLANNVEYGPEAFEAIAGTSEESSVVAVSSASKYDTLAKLLDAAKAAPDSITFAVNFGAPSHFLAHRIETESDGAQFRYVQSGGGSDRFGAIAGDHVDATIFSVGEYLQFQSSGLRALAVFDTERNRAIPDVPTGRESGLDVINTHMQFWWAPKGTPPERIERLRLALKQAMATEQVRQALAAIQAEPTFLDPAQVRERLAEAEQELAIEAAAAPAHLSWLPAILLSSAMILGVVTLLRSRSESSVLHLPAVRGQAAWFALATVVYAALLSSELLDFRIATLAFMAAAGVILIGSKKKALAGFALTSLVVALGIHFVMSGLMGVDLP